MSSALQSRIDELVAELNEHSYRYHVLDMPIIDDAEYDALYNELKELEANDAAIIHPDSPTQRVGEPVSGALPQVPHTQMMLSLANARNEAELIAWENRNVRLLGGEKPSDTNLRYVTEPKIDGLAMSLTYINGRFERAVTRGDGVVGEDVSHNVRTIASVPMRLRSVADETFPEQIEVRGEVYISRSGFDQLNEQRIERGEAVFMNPRNAAAGTIRQLNPQLAASRPLGFFAYSLAQGSEALNVNSHDQAMNWLSKAGFRTSPEHRVHDSIDAVYARCLEWENKRAGLDYDIDGVVVKVDEAQLQEELGIVGRDPRWAIAFKFAPTTVTTKLLAIPIAVGRTGSLTPYAELEPVNVGGVMVSRANLHNAYDIERKDIRVGDTVIVQRAGDVIPQVVGPVVDARDGSEIPFQTPTHCPSCETPVQYHADEAILRCPNSACPERNLRLIEHFAGRSAMDIDGLGEKAVRRFSGGGLLRTISDIYRLEPDSIATLSGYGQTSAEKLIRSIDESRTRTLDKLLFGLGIRHVGQQVAADLARHFRSIDNMLRADVDVIAAIPGVGQVIAESVAAWAADEGNQELVRELQSLGVVTELSDDQLPAAANDGPLIGLSVVVTGVLKTLSRKAAGDMIESAGGRVTGSVSGSTDLLVAGEKAGSKKAKAEKLGVPIISERELYERIGAPVPETALSEH